MAWAGLFIFLACFAIIAALSRHRHSNSFSDDGGSDVIEAITDPGLPAIGYERADPWVAQMTRPAPPIVAYPIDPARAERLIESWDRQAALS